MNRLDRFFQVWILTLLLAPVVVGLVGRYLLHDVHRPLIYRLGPRGFVALDVVLAGAVAVWVAMRGRRRPPRPPWQDLTEHERPMPRRPRGW